MSRPAADPSTPPAAAAIVDLYERHADDWDRDRRAEVGSEAGWLARFEALLPEGATVLDLGCGSGQPIARHLVARGFGVVGVDASASLIALCRQRLPEQAWIVADMRTLALGRRFDGLVAWDSFFHLAHDDQRAMFAVFAAHAAPGAPLLFTTGHYHGEAIGTFHGEPLYHASLAPAEYRRLLDDHGFDVVAHAAEDPDCGRHTVWLARRR